MKGLLERLLARQARLVAALEEAVPTTSQERRTTQLPPEEREALRAAEQQALDAMTEPLGRGDLNAAASLLGPHAKHAQDTRTLTTLSRIRSLQGDLDEALALLKRAEALDPGDLKVLGFIADLLQSWGRHRDALFYRRRVAFSQAAAPAEAFAKLIDAIIKATHENQSLPLSEVRVALDKLRKSPDLNDVTRSAIANSLHAVPKFASLARDFIAEGDPCPNDCLEVDAKWRTLVNWRKETQAPMHQLPIGGARGHRPVIVQLDDVVMHPALKGTPMLEGTPTLFSGQAAGKVGVKTEQAHSPLLLNSDKTAVLRLPREMRTVEHPALYVGGTGDYHEDLVFNFGALATVARLGFGRDLPLVLHADAPGYQSELLRLLGFDGWPVVHVGRDRPTRFAHLWFPSRLAAGDYWMDPMLPAWYRARAEASSPVAQVRKRLYVRSRDAQRCRVVNEDALLPELVARGFEPVEPGELSLSDRVTLFGQASHVVGTDDVAMTDLLFMPANGQVTLLHTPAATATGRRLRFETLAAAAGQAVVRLTCTPDRVTTNRRGLDADLAVDVGELLRSLDTAPGKPSA